MEESILRMTMNSRVLFVDDLILRLSWCAGEEVFSMIMIQYILRESLLTNDDYFGFVSR